MTTALVTVTETQPLDFPAAVVSGGMPPCRSVEERVRTNKGINLKPTLSVSMDPSSNLDAITNDQWIPNNPTCAEESLSTSEHISNQYGASMDLESAETKHEPEKARNSKRKHKHKHKLKKEINLPCRASKRLAGIKLDPVPELKTSRQACRAADKEAVITNVDKSFNFMSNGTAKPIDSGAINTLESGQCKLQENQELGSNNDQEHVRILDSKLNYSLDLPLDELLTDPCIAFAIQILTGVTFESCENTQKNSELRIIKHSETSNAAGEGNTREIKLQNTSDEKDGCYADGEIGQKANENSGSSSSEIPIDISWKDPCIEFAIKTLTETDPSSEKLLQRQLNSSLL